MPAPRRARKRRRERATLPRLKPEEFLASNSCRQCARVQRLTRSRLAHLFTIPSNDNLSACAAAPRVSQLQPVRIAHSHYDFTLDSTTYGTSVNSAERWLDNWQQRVALATCNTISLIHSHTPIAQHGDVSGKLVQLGPYGQHSRPTIAARA
jgi:hypothetical protein